MNWRTRKAVFCTAHRKACGRFLPWEILFTYHYLGVQVIEMMKGLKKSFSLLSQHFIFCSQREMSPITPFDARKHASPSKHLFSATVRIISMAVFDTQEGGVNALTSELSSTRAVYQCWYGLELDPPESEIRYCVRGKWTGENPLCGNYKLNI